MKMRRLSFRSLNKLIAELDAVRGLLPDAYGGYTDDEDDDVSFKAGHIESSEIEVALSAVITTMTVECDLQEEPESTAELMENLFSLEDDLVGMASNLEDAVNGYFGELFGENLNLADDYLRDIIANLTVRRDEWKKKRDLQKRLKFG